MTYPRKNKYSPHKRPEAGYAFERLAREDPERLREISAKAGRASVHRQGARPINARLVAAKAAKRAQRAAEAATAPSETL